MKKILILISGVLVALSASAQKSAVNAAQGKLFDPIDPKGAIKLITPALENEETKNDGKTWFIAGNAYFMLGEEELKQEVMDQDSNHKLVAADAFEHAYNCYLESRRLEQIPNEKGKVKDRFKSEIATKMKQTLQTFLAAGSEYNNLKDYDNVIKNFKLFLDVQKMDVLANDKTLSTDSLNNQITFYVGEFSLMQKDEATATQYYESLIGKNYEEEIVYDRLVNIYKDKDEAKFLDIIEKGIAKFPKNPVFIQHLINYYISKNENEKAITYINTALEKDPKNVDYLNVRGNLLQDINDYKAAKVVYEEIISINPNHLKANMGLGDIYFTEAEDMYDKASKILDDKLYTAKMNETKAVYKKSLDYYTKARNLIDEINPALEKRIKNIKIKAQIK